MIKMMTKTMRIRPVSVSGVVPGASAACGAMVMTPDEGELVAAAEPAEVLVAGAVLPVAGVGVLAEPGSVVVDVWVTVGVGVVLDVGLARASSSSTAASA